MHDDVQVHVEAVWCLVTVCVSQMQPHKLVQANPRAVLDVHATIIYLCGVGQLQACQLPTGPMRPGRKRYLWEMPHDCACPPIILGIYTTVAVELVRQLAG